MTTKTSMGGRQVMANHRFPSFVFGLGVTLMSAPAMSTAVIDNKPLTVTSAVPGNMVLLPSVEWPTVVTQANQPGVDNANYSAAKAYSGYFNPDVCYTYEYHVNEVNRYFRPAAHASSRTCTTSGDVKLWSGNFLNWAGMQAADTFRMALTGGYRVHRPADGNVSNVTVRDSSGASVTHSVSELASVTYLEKANSDRWDNAYTKLRRLDSTTLVAGATPAKTDHLIARIGGLRNQMWFRPSSSGIGNSTRYDDPKAITLPVTDGNQNDGNSTSAIPYQPLWHQLPNADTTTTDTDNACATGEPDCHRLDNGKYRRTKRGRNENYAVSMRVQVCDGVYDRRDFCTQYGSYYKPEGLLQKNAYKSRFGLFSYLAESGQYRNGGVMRSRLKFIAPWTVSEIAGTTTLYPDRGRIGGIDNPEWDPATGMILDNPDPAMATATNNNVQAGAGYCTDTDNDTDCTVRYSGVINYVNRFGQINTGMSRLKEYDNLSEMYYTALRYMRGLANVSDYSKLEPNNSSHTSSGKTGRFRNADGLPVIEDWYGTGANAAAPSWSERLVGQNGDSTLYQCQTNVFLGIGDTNTNNEDSNHSGDSGLSVSTWRTKAGGASEGRNLTAGLAYWAHTQDIRTDIPNVDLGGGRFKGQSVATYWVDVVEQNDLKSKSSNQYYLATRFGGYDIPATDYDANGNATARNHNASWWGSNEGAWTSATQTVNQVTGLGGTGDFKLPRNMYLANDGQRMIDGLTEAFQRITDSITGSGGSFASNTTKLEAGAYTYQAQYLSNGWGGRLIASSVDTSSGELTARWDAATWLSDANSHYTKRKMFHVNGSSMREFISNRSTTGAVVNSPTLVKPSSWAGTDNQLKYILGDRTHERQSTVSGSTREFRNRNGMLGDIVNSAPVYAGAPNLNLYRGDASYASFAASNASRKKVVYVGANDGFLHAFDTSNGRELFAFMPTESLSVLSRSDASTGSYPYWDPAYDHAYSVDGELTIADVKVGTSWKTVLVGTMGRGGKSIFALDVTNPDSPSFLWEKTAADPVIGSMLGNSLGRPLIAKVADGDWRVFMGNGPNSSGGRAAVLMLDAYTGADMGSTVVSTDSNNGLAPVNVWDGRGVDADSRPDGNFETVYAGDLLGNVWKFDIETSSATKIFQTAANQPITISPLVARNPYSATADTWLFFGTGRYLSKSDTSDDENAHVQSWYGVIDRGQIVARTTLKQVRITDEDDKGRVIEKVGAPGANGWFINLQSPNEAAAGSTVTARGERMVVPNFFQGMVLIGTTRFPFSNDPCTPTGKGFTMAIDPFTGGRLDRVFFDADMDGSVGDEGDYKGGNTGTPYSGVGYGSGPNNPIFMGQYMYTSLDDGTYARYRTNAGMAEVRRVSWREVLNVD